MASAAVTSISNQAQPDFKVATFPVSPTDSRKHHVQTTLNYYKAAADGSPPLPSISGKPETYERESETLEVTVHDISGNELDYTLDKNGFQLYYHESKQKLFVDEEEIKNEYYPETEQLLKDATGASKIFIFDHTIRRPETTTGQAVPGGPRGPVQRVHIDQSYQASENRVTYHLPDEASTLLKGHFQIINVWRPIKTIYKDPLAVADAHSVPDSDLVPVKLIYPNREGETYTVRPNKAHKWYYRYGQTPDIVTLIKCFDSKLDGRARRVPHTAFVNPETAAKEEYPERESIEIRALVFYPHDSSSTFAE